jgi:molecular chaperone IbpA
MNALNLTPLFRTAIGFDRLARLMDTATSADVSYPPYNIEKTGDDSYRLTMAVAGFGPDDIEMTVKENTLHIAGRAGKEDGRAELLYRFVLADHIVVEGAELQNGLLHVALKRVVPEALKPRRIPVSVGAPKLANDGEPAAKAA